MSEQTSLYDEAVALGYWLASQLGEHVDDQSDLGETLIDTVKRLLDKRDPLSPVERRESEKRAGPSQGTGMSERLARYETVVYPASSHSGIGGGGTPVSVLAANRSEAWTRALEIGWSGHPDDARVLFRSVTDSDPRPPASEGNTNGSKS